MKTGAWHCLRPETINGSGSSNTGERSIDTKTNAGAASEVKGGARPAGRCHVPGQTCAVDTVVSESVVASHSKHACGAVR